MQKAQGAASAAQAPPEAGRIGPLAQSAAVIASYQRAAKRFARCGEQRNPAAAGRM